MLAEPLYRSMWIKHVGQLLIFLGKLKTKILNLNDVKCKNDTEINNRKVEFFISGVNTVLTVNENMIISFCYFQATFIGCAPKDGNKKLLAPEYLLGAKMMVV